MRADVAAEWGEWDVEGDDFGGFMVRHRHWDGLMLALYYPHPNRPWAECSICGATLDMDDTAGRQSVGR